MNSFVKFEFICQITFQMENPETTFSLLNQFDEPNPSNYTQFIDDIILWGFELSANFQSYQNSKQQAEIIELAV